MTSLPPSVLYLVIVTKSSVSYPWFLLPHNYVACTLLQHAWAPPLREGIFSVLAPTNDGESFPMFLSSNFRDRNVLCRLLSRLLFGCLWLRSPLLAPKVWPRAGCGRYLWDKTWLPMSFSWAETTGWAVLPRMPGNQQFNIVKWKTEEKWVCLLVVPVDTGTLWQEKESIEKRESTFMKGIKFLPPIQ